MQIPDDPLFKEFLSGCSVVETPTQEPFVYFASPAHFRKTSKKPMPGLYLQYPALQLKLDSVLDVISRCMSSHGCPADRDIAISVLALFAEMPERDSCRVAYANDMFSKTLEAQLLQVFVMPNPCPPNNQVQIGEVRLGPFDPKQILYWAGRAEVYYPMDLNELKGNLCIERNRIPLKIIDWVPQKDCLNQLFKRWGEEAAGASILDWYYQSIYRLFAKQIPILIKKRLQILEGGALTGIEIDSFLSSNFQTSIGLYSWKGQDRRRGWALLGAPVLHTNFVPTNIFKDCQEWIKTEFSFHEEVDYALGAAIDSYSHFLQRAQSHYVNGRLDDAFLHFMIALDLLLGEENRSSDSVSSRAAILVHRQLESPLKEQVKKLKLLYGQRSKFVHEGRIKKVQESISEADQICCEILWNVLAAAGRDTELTLSEWLKQIDFIGASLEAGREVEEAVFSAAGIPPIGEKRIPPNRMSREIDNSPYTPIELRYGRPNSSSVD